MVPQYIVQSSWLMYVPVFETCGKNVCWERERERERDDCKVKSIRDYLSKPMGYRIGHIELLCLFT